VRLNIHRRCTTRQTRSAVCCYGTGDGRGTAARSSSRSGRARHQGKSPGLVGFRGPDWSTFGVSLRALGWAIASWSVSYRSK
jgi:hypothetical protein